jgi:hypothetical protein
MSISDKLADLVKAQSSLKTPLMLKRVQQFILLMVMFILV